MKKAGILMIIGAVLLLGLFMFPLWKITLEAPQYPDPLGMYIYIKQGMQGEEAGHIQTIDGLNHYIGMKKLPANEEMWEFKAFPIVVEIMVILGVLIGILGMVRKIGPNWFLGWLVVMGILGILGFYDFYQWLMDYGHNLDPHAIMSFTDDKGNPMAYSPPLFGHKKMLNFDVYSYPRQGAYWMLAGMILVLIAFLTGKRNRKQTKTN